MRVAVTVWDDRISPVFDASRRLLIAAIQGNRITERSYMVFDLDEPASLAKSLSTLEVDVLICGAVSQAPATIIANGGITLIPFIAGRVDRVLTAYARGVSLAPAFGMPGYHGNVTDRKSMNHQ